MSIFSRIFRYYFKKGSPRGFTLIELLVVSLIIMLITAFVLFRQEGFNNSTLLRSLSYGIALSIRQAQVYGVSVRESAAGSNVFAGGYGVYFNNNGLADSSHYFLFADTNSNGRYDSGEQLPRFTIGNGRGTDYLIKSYCVYSPGGGHQCDGTITPLTIYFRRPNPDACFATSLNTTACAAGGTSSYTYAYIQLKSFTGTDYRTIKITSTGQIAVCQPNLDAAGVAAC